jgi:hypothetical protein
MSEPEYVRLTPRAVVALDYPGTPAPGSGVLDGDRFWPGRELDRLDDRTMVLAVGANASPSVLAHKLHRAGVTGTVGMVRAEVTGLAVGHSAYVSRCGYVPAGPYAADETTAVVGLWLTGEQCTAVDATEPNYDRIDLRHHDHPLRLEIGDTPTTYGVYVSHWGVLAADGLPLRLGTQRELFARLSVMPALAALAPWDDPEAAVRELTDPATHALIRDGFVAAGWVADAALGQRTRP